MTATTTATDDDRREIHDLMLAYCRAVDRGRYDEIEACYAPDGVDHHTGFTGTAAEYAAWLRTKLPSFAGTMHMLANHRAEIIGDRAVSETYGQAVHWGAEPDDPQSNFTSGFRYVDHLVKTSGRWLIRERFAVREWTRSEVGRFEAAEAEGPRGRRDDQDPLWLLRRQVLDQ